MSGRTVPSSRRQAARKPAPFDAEAEFREAEARGERLLHGPSADHFRLFQRQVRNFCAQAGLREPEDPEDEAQVVDPQAPAIERSCERLLRRLQSQIGAGEPDHRQMTEWIDEIITLLRELLSFR